MNKVDIPIYRDIKCTGYMYNVQKHFMVQCQTSAKPKRKHFKLQLRLAAWLVGCLSGSW